MTQLHNENGQTIGYFLTVDEHERLRKLEEEHRQLREAWLQSLFPEDEVKKAEEDQDEFTTEEVLQYLQTL